LLNKIAANRAKKPQEDPIVKKQRLLEWWQKQYDNIDKNREKRQYDIALFGLFSPKQMLIVICVFT
jgi:hypothetical protein